MFETGTSVEVGCAVTHPPGTSFDAEGNPIPPSSDAQNTGTEQSEENKP